MAYELALMTFHYVPEVQNVAVLMPTLLKGQKARILVLARARRQVRSRQVAHVCLGPGRKVNSSSARRGRR